MKWERANLVPMVPRWERTTSQELNLGHLCRSWQYAQYGRSVAKSVLTFLKKDFGCIWNHILLRCNSRRKMLKFIVFTVGEKYPDDLVFLPRFWSLHPLDTLLSHEATGENLWMAVKRHNWCYVTWQWRYDQCSSSALHSYYTNSYDYILSYHLQMIQKKYLLRGNVPHHYRRGGICGCSLTFFQENGEKCTAKAVTAIFKFT